MSARELMRACRAQAKARAFALAVWFYRQGNRPERLTRRMWLLRRKYKFLMRLHRAVMPPSSDHCVHCWRPFANPNGVMKSIFRIELPKQEHELAPRIIRVEAWFAGDPVSRKKHQRIAARGRILSRVDLRLCRWCRLKRPKFFHVHIATNGVGAVTGVEYVWLDENGHEYTRYMWPEEKPSSDN